MSNFEAPDEQANPTNEARSLYAAYAQHEQAGIIFHGTLQHLGDLALAGHIQSAEARELLSQAERAASMPPLAGEPLTSRFHSLRQGYYVGYEDRLQHREFPPRFLPQATTLSGSLVGVKAIDENIVAVGVGPFSTLPEGPLRDHYRRQYTRWPFHHPLAVRRNETDLDRPVWVPVESLLLPKMDFSYLRRQWQQAQRAGEVITRLIPPPEA